MISRASSPGKVILFGEHFVVYGVNAILSAINRRVTVTAESVGDHLITIKSGPDRLRLEPGCEIAEVDPHLRPLYFIADRMLKHGRGGVDITVGSEIPPGMGLGSSSACCVAGAAAISGLFCRMSNDAILGLAIDAERSIQPDTSGADCTVCTHGGTLLYGRGAGFSRIRHGTDIRLVIASSATAHSTGRMVSAVRRHANGDPGGFAGICAKESELVGRAAALLEAGDVAGMGELASRNQSYLESIGVSNGTLGGMIRTADGPSFGSKITGAGGGGCIIALTDATNTRRTMDALAVYHECFSTRIGCKGLEIL